MTNKYLDKNDLNNFYADALYFSLVRKGYSEYIAKKLSLQIKQDNAIN